MRNLVLWGHQLDDYKKMFDLDEASLKGSLLEYGSGPSAVNASLHQTAKAMVSIDPLFDLNKIPLQQEVDEVFEERAKILAAKESSLNFGSYKNLNGLIKERKKGLAIFFADYEQGKREGRYLALKEKELPFADFSFELALSSHFLLMPRDRPGEEDLIFYANTIKELTRVAKELRIFPLIDSEGEPSPFLGPILLHLQQENFGTEVREVAYHLQPRGNAMLRIWAQTCPLAS